MNCIIIEDEPLALERAADFVKKLPFLNLLSTFDNAIDGLTFLKSHTADLLFLDIKMDEFSGIQLLESTTIEGEVIITTAYDKYALKGYDLNVTDYLLKPYTFERFVQAVDKAYLNLTKSNSGKEVDFIFVKTENRLEKINLKDVLYIEGMGSYRRIHTLDKRIMTLQTFREFEQLVPSNRICRIHKSYMISIAKIETVERSRVKIKDQIIPISDSYKKVFFELIGNSK